MFVSIQTLKWGPTSSQGHPQNCNTEDSNILGSFPLLPFPALPYNWTSRSSTADPLLLWLAFWLATFITRLGLTLESTVLWRTKTCPCSVVPTSFKYDPLWTLGALCLGDVILLTYVEGQLNISLSVGVAGLSAIFKCEQGPLFLQEKGIQEAIKEQNDYSRARKP